MMSEEEFALNVVEDGGCYDLLVNWGMNADDFEVKEGDVYRLVVELDKVKGTFLQLLSDIDEAAGKVVANL